MICLSISTPKPKVNIFVNQYSRYHRRSPYQTTRCRIQRILIYSNELIILRLFKTQNIEIRSYRNYLKYLMRSDYLARNLVKNTRNMIKSTLIARNLNVSMNTKHKISIDMIFQCLTSMRIWLILSLNKLLIEYDIEINAQEKVISIDDVWIHHKNIRLNEYVDFITFLITNQQYVNNYVQKLMIISGIYNHSLFLQLIQITLHLYNKWTQTCI